MSYHYNDTVKIKGKPYQIKIPTSGKILMINGRNTPYTYKPDTGYFYRAGSRVTNDLMTLLNMIL